MSLCTLQFLPILFRSRWTWNNSLANTEARLNVPRRVTVPALELILFSVGADERLEGCVCSIKLFRVGRLLISPVIAFRTLKPGRDSSLPFMLLVVKIYNKSFAYLNHENRLGFVIFWRSVISAAHVPGCFARWHFVTLQQTCVFTFRRWSTNKFGQWLLLICLSI